MDEKSTTADENDQEIESQATDPQNANQGNDLQTSNTGQTQSGDDTKTSDTTDKETETPATLDADLDDWIKSRKAPAPQNDEERQAYQSLRNEQREFTKQRQADSDSKELAKSLEDKRGELDTGNEDEDEDPLEARLKAVEADRDRERTIRIQSEFYTDNKVSDAEHKAILEVINEKVTRASSNEAKLRALDTWGSTDALPDLLDLAKARLAKSTDTSFAEEAAVKAERDRIARESNANSTNRGAKTVTTGDKTPEQERLDRFSTW